MKNYEILRQRFNEAMSIDENRIGSWDFPIHDEYDFSYLSLYPNEKRYDPKEFWRDRIITHELAYSIIERGKELTPPDYRSIFRNLLEINKNWHKEHPGVTLNIETEFDNLIDMIGVKICLHGFSEKPGLRKILLKKHRISSFRT